MNIDLKEVHIGHEIAKRLEELKMNKSEFGRQIGVPQQHINRILERETMETKKLVKVCNVLDVNFFAMFCHFPTNVNAYLAAVTLGDGNAENNVGDAAALAQVELLKANLESAGAMEKELREQIAQLKQRIEDKDAMIKVLEKQIK